VSKVLAQHWPHFGFLVVGVGVFVWFALRPERSDLPAPVEVSHPSAPAPANVKRSVARRGLLALGPLVGAVATGAILYGVDVGGGSPAGAVIWVHSGISALALLLVVYKVADVGLARLRRAFTRQGLPQLVSLVLGVVSVPLAVTGVALLFVPSTSSVMAYLHLISSAWWTGLLVWHLRRYLVASLRAAFKRPVPVHADRTAPTAARVASVPRPDPQPSQPA
jgi:hypothetical protein